MTDKVIRVKIDAGDSKAQIESLDKSMVLLGAEADKVVTSTAAATKAVDSVGIAAIESSKEVKVFAAEVASVAVVNTNLTKTAEAVKVAISSGSNAVGDFGRKAGMAGMQMQQFVGQVTAGTSPMVALSQQAADLGFVLGAPLLGAIVGIAAALGSVLAPSLLSSKSEIEKLDEALKNIKDTSGETKDGIYILNEQIVELSKVSAAAAKVKLAANIFEAEAAARQAAAAFAETFDAGRIQFAVDTYSSGVAGITGVSNEVVGVTRRIGEQFGLQGQAAIDFGAKVTRALGEIQKAPTTGSFDKFIGLVSDQAAASGTKNATVLAGALLDLAGKGRQAALEMQRGRDAVANLESSLKDADNAVTGLATKSDNLTKQLELENIALTQGELAAKLQAAAWQTGAESVDKLDANIKNLITTNYQLEASQKAAKESQAELTNEINADLENDKKQAEINAKKNERAARDQERIDQRISNMRLETQTLASESMLQKAVRDELFTQEEADLAMQTSARLLAASTEYQQLLELDNISKEQQLQAEIAFREQVNAINEQYDAAKLQLKQRALNQEISLMANSAQAGLQLIGAFGSKSFQAQKNASIASSIVSITAGVAQALNNPYPANLGFAAQVAAQGASLISTIKSTNIGSGGGSAGSITAASAALPTTPQAAPTVGAFEIVGLSGLADELKNMDPDQVLPVSYTQRIVASLESVQRLQGA